mgnify:FL=1
MRLDVEILTRSLILVHGIISLSHSQTCSQFHKVEGGGYKKDDEGPRRHQDPRGATRSHRLGRQF